MKTAEVAKKKKYRARKERQNTLKITVKRSEKTVAKKNLLFFQIYAKNSISHSFVLIFFSKHSFANIY